MVGWARVLVSLPISKINFDDRIPVWNRISLSGITELTRRCTMSNCVFGHNFFFSEIQLRLRGLIHFFSLCSSLLLCKFPNTLKCWDFLRLLLLLDEPQIQSQGHIPNFHSKVNCIMSFIFAQPRANHSKFNSQCLNRARAQCIQNARFLCVFFFLWQNRH